MKIIGIILIIIAIVLIIFTLSTASEANSSEVNQALYDWSTTDTIRSIGTNVLIFGVPGVILYVVGKKRQKKNK